MTGKERVHAVLEGKPVDRYPVACLYSGLVYQDHFAELTRQPAWKRYAWLHSPPEDHLATYRRMVEQAPFDLLEPHSHAAARTARERFEFVEKDGHPCRHDRQTDEWVPLADHTASGHATDYVANEKQHVFSREDVANIEITKADAILATGINDYLDAAVAELGKEHFIVSGGVVGTVYSCSGHLGLTRVFETMLDDPELMDALCAKGCAQNIEQIRRMAAAGGDAIFIDDATATNDMISVQAYERFSLPYMKTMVEEIHRLGHKAILIYFGGIADRLEQIASIGADGLQMEATMKGYVNDIEQTVRAVGDRVTVFANLDPVGVIQKGTDETLEKEIRRQVEAGRKGRGFVVASASPITPGTPVSRIQRFIELSREIGVSKR